MGLFTYILLIIGAVVVWALFNAIRTNRDLNDPVFRLKVEVLVGKYIQQHGVQPPDHLMPEIYKQARKELRN